MSLLPESTILPLTVAAAHLEACAAELDRAPETHLGEIVAVLKHLVAGQRHLSDALTGLAERVGEARFGALAAMPSAEMAALVEILQAAGATPARAPVCSSCTGFCLTSLGGMRTVWRGTIGVGSSAIPVKAYSATEEPGSGQLQLHLTDGGWLRPEVPATKPCVLLAEALLTAGRVALVKVAIRLVPPTAAIQDESLTELLRALQSSAQDRTHADQRVANAKAAANKAAEAKGRARKATSKAKSAPRTRR